MKKKILGLLLALCLVVGLLSVTALADEYSEKAYLKLYCVGTGYSLADGQYRYLKLENDTVTNLGSDPTEANIIIQYNKTAGKLTVELKNITTNTTSSDIIVIGHTTDERIHYDVDIIVSGSCTLGTSSNTKTPIKSIATGTITIKGDDNDNTVDQLTLTRNLSNGAAHVLNLAGDLVIDGVKVTAKQPATSGGSAIVANNVTIQNGSDVTLFSDSKYAIDATGNVLVEDSTLTMSSAGAAIPLVNVADGKTITIDNSTVTAGFTTNGGSLFSTKPVMDYDGYVFSGSASNPAVSEDAATLGNITTDGIELTNEYNEDLTTDVSGKYRYFSIKPCTHATVTDHDGDCTTAKKCSVCGVDVGTAEAAHAGPNQTDCTVAVACTNTGCTKNVHEATTHTGGTATCIAKAVCTECGTAYGEFAAHTPKAGEYACSVAHPCAVEGCTGNYREAGTHTGGTATCTKKAECSSCGTEYGELAAHTPEADDKNCATAIKCSVCKAEITAAKEHKYTDNADTACDNAGCEHTRKVDAPTTKPNTNNVPQTGDSFNMVLWISLLAISVVGFVSLMVFRKKHA